MRYTFEAIHIAIDTLPWLGEQIVPFLLWSAVMLLLWFVQLLCTFGWMIYAGIFYVILPGIRNLCLDALPWLPIIASLCWVIGGFILLCAFGIIVGWQVLCDICSVVPGMASLTLRALAQILCPPPVLQVPITHVRFRSAFARRVETYNGLQHPGATNGDREHEIFGASLFPDLFPGSNPRVAQHESTLQIRK
jgi:hypothetical protein